MTGKTTAYCLLGSNLGDRLTFLRRAAFALAATESVELVRGSSVYETAPWGKTDQPSFLNAAVKLRTALEPEALLDRFQEIERRLGRAPSDERWGPRPIDLDLALFGNRTIRTARLTVPHPHLGERLFALEPLLEIAPGLRDPATGEAYARVREALRNAERGTQNTECGERNAERGMLNAEQGDGESRGRGKGGRRAGPEVARIGPLILNAWLLDSAFEELKELFPSKPQTRNAKLETRNAKLETRNSKPETRNPKLETRNSKREMRNPKPEIRNPKPETLLYESRSPEDTERLAEVFAGHLKGGEVLALAGNLGAGKTCFARGLARGLGIPGPITSPSYVLVKSYEGRLTLHHGDFYRLAGAPDRATDDAKRAETGAEVGAAHDGRDGARGRAADSAAADGGAATGRAAAERQDSAPSSEPPDLASLGLEDYLDDPNAVVLIEWADRYPAWLEPPFYLVEITGSGEAPRWILARRIEVSS